MKMELLGDLTAIAHMTVDGMKITVIHVGARKTLARLYLDGAQSVSMRLVDNVLAFADDRGRVGVLDLEFGLLRRDFRITP